MEYTIAKEEHGWTVQTLSENRYFRRVWAYTTLKEALEGIQELFNPPILIPEGTVVLGAPKEPNSEQ